MKTRRLILSKDNERLLIVSNRVNGTFIVRNKQQKYKIITVEDIKEVLR
jgi:predicted ATP-dependent protease